MGEAEFIELRLDSTSAWFLRRMRRMMKKIRMQVAAMAKKPNTTITAMAQRGNWSFPLLKGWTLPLAFGQSVVGVPLIVVTTDDERAERDESDASSEESDAAELEDAAAAADDEEAATTSATVVSIVTGEYQRGRRDKVQTRTDGAEDGLRDLVAIQRFITSDDHPIEGVALVSACTVPPQAIIPKPSIVHLCPDPSRLILRVGLIPKA